MVSGPLVAVDVGNARIKLGLFDRDDAAAIPEPLGVLPLLGDAPALEQIVPWLAATSKHPAREQACRRWIIASVNRPATSRLIEWLRDHRPADRITLLACGDLPLEVRLSRPDMVGIDRLVDAVAVNRLRRPGSAAVIVDVGTAITIDLVSPDGAFLGGAILPGLGMAARALHEFTDLLPLVNVCDLTSPPPAIGTATVPAIESGLFWGTVGAIRELIERMHQGAISQPSPPADVFLTGGAGAAVAELLGPDARYVPHLTLAGIALAAGLEPTDVGTP
ncbi:MAG: type III pantothenate kinase [Planctomycetaceae bacterium]|nr:type III pantothenate kinase [Planctomycetaceae bacterium]